MISKTIHYCWFGGNPKPELIEKCIASWHKFCPDYEIIEWNESNYDVNAHEYTKKAYADKKWAFLSDYVRIDIVNKCGGIYLDTDVELKQNLDYFLEYNGFFFFETARFINSGLGFGAVAGHPTLKIMLKDYDDNYGMEYLACPEINTRGIIKCSPSLIRDGSTQIINETIFASGSEYEKIATHHFTGLWNDGDKVNEKKWIFKPNRFKSALRNPKKFEWVSKHFGSKGEKIYTWAVYDLPEYGCAYFVKRKIHRK